MTAIAVRAFHPKRHLSPSTSSTRIKKKEGVGCKGDGKGQSDMLSDYKNQPEQEHSVTELKNISFEVTFICYTVDIQQLTLLFC